MSIKKYFWRKKQMTRWLKQATKTELLRELVNKILRKK